MRTRDELEELSRSELQALAKSLQIPANLKSTKIIDRILESEEDDGGEAKKAKKREQDKKRKKSSKADSEEDDGGETKKYKEREQDKERKKANYEEDDGGEAKKAKEREQEKRGKKGIANSNDNYEIKVNLFPKQASSEPSRTLPGQFDITINFILQLSSVGKPGKFVLDPMDVEFKVHEFIPSSAPSSSFPNHANLPPPPPLHYTTKMVVPKIGNVQTTFSSPPNKMYQVFAEVLYKVPSGKTTRQVGTTIIVVDGNGLAFSEDFRFLINWLQKSKITRTDQRPSGKLNQLLLFPFTSSSRSFPLSFPRVSSSPSSIINVSAKGEALDAVLRLMVSEYPLARVGGIQYFVEELDDKKKFDMPFDFEVKAGMQYAIMATLSRPNDTTHYLLQDTLLLDVAKDGSMVFTQPPTYKEFYSRPGNSPYD